MKPVQFSFSFSLPFFFDLFEPVCPVLLVNFEFSMFLMKSSYVI